MLATADRLYNAEQVRRLDRSAIDGHGIPGIELMERAGRAAFESAREAVPKARNWLVFCGGGNNGGDGYVVARLAREAGLHARVCALKSPERLSGDAALAADRWTRDGGQTNALPPGADEGADLVFDALLGTGLDRAPEGDYRTAIEWINGCGHPVIAVDVPSGLSSDSGVAPGLAVRADRTITFVGNKPGLYTADGPDHAGAVRFASLDIPDSIHDPVSDHGILIRENFIGSCLSPRPRNSHKGSFGWVLGIGGGSGMSGAIRLCGEAALRSGAGKVTLSTRPEHADWVNLACPELMVRGIRKGREIHALLEQVDVAVVGTGLGQTAWSEDLFRCCLSARIPMVLDADGLNIFARLFPSPGQASESPRGNWVLTPHPAEAGRLLGCPAREVQQDRVAAARAIAERFDAVVVLKGCGTVVAAPDGRWGICPHGNPGMATAGTGDVLAGVVGALIAQRLDLWSAAACGVTAHALAGDLASSHIGERGLIASDIVARLPTVLNPA